MTSTKQLRAKNAAYMREYRRRGHTPVTRQTLRNKARHRAVWQLADRHREEFEDLVAPILDRLYAEAGLDP